MRVAVSHPVTIAFDGRSRAGTTIDVSRTGLLVAVPDGLTLWSQVAVDLPGLGDRGARVVRRDEERFGLLFREPLDAAAFAAIAGADLAGPAEEEAEPAPVPRTAPWAFGRDRIKTFRRRAQEFAPPPPRR